MRHSITFSFQGFQTCCNFFSFQGFLSAEDLDDILRGMGFRPSKEELKDILEEIDEDGSGEIEFAEFCQVRWQKLERFIRKDFFVYLVKGSRFLSVSGEIELF